MHSTAAVAVTLGADPTAVLGRVFDAQGWRWASVPYARPGSPLAQAVTSLGEPSPDVVVLGNHGIVVGARRQPLARRPVRRGARRAARGAGCRGPRGPDGGPARRARRLPLVRRPPPHRARRTPRPRPAARRRLVADQVVFLGASALLVDDVPAEGQPVAVVEGAGVLLADGARPSVLALVDFLADVARVLPGEVLTRCGRGRGRSCSGWDAEHHRQALSARDAARLAAEGPDVQLVIPMSGFGERFRRAGYDRSPSR